MTRENSFNSAKFIERLKLIIGDQPIRKFARQVGLSDTLLHNYLSGSVPSLEKAIAIAEGANVDFSWLCLGKGTPPSGIVINTSNSNRSSSVHSEPANDDEFTLIDSYAIHASAGHGATVEHELQTEPMSFRTDWLRKEGFPAERLAIIRAKGDSMEPTISDNDVILILLTNGDAPRDGLYVIRLEGGLFVKRLQFEPLGSVLIKSDNPAYSSTKIAKEDRSQLHVIGRVVWAGKKF